MNLPETYSPILKRVLRASIVLLPPKLARTRRKAHNLSLFWSLSSFGFFRTDLVHQFLQSRSVDIQSRFVGAGIRMLNFLAERFQFLGKNVQQETAFGVIKLNVRFHKLFFFHDVF